MADETRHLAGNAGQILRGQGGQISQDKEGVECKTKTGKYKMLEPIKQSDMVRS